jgi:hypothetical protein
MRASVLISSRSYRGERLLEHIERELDFSERSGNLNALH